MLITMKKKNLKLSQLKVQSFITELKQSEIKGGNNTAGCYTGIYPTSPAIACANTGTNHYNCPCDIVSRENTCDTLNDCLK